MVACAILQIVTYYVKKLNRVYSTKNLLQEIREKHHEYLGMTLHFAVINAHVLLFEMVSCVRSTSNYLIISRVPVTLHQPYYAFEIDCNSKLISKEKEVVCYFVTTIFQCLAQRNMHSMQLLSRFYYSRVERTSTCNCRKL